MSIFSFEAQHEKEMRKERDTFQKSIDRAVKKAQIEDKKMEDFFKSEGALIFINYLKNDKEILLRAMRAKPKSLEEALALQERYSLRCQDLEMIEMYVSRVKPT